MRRYISRLVLLFSASAYAIEPKLEATVKTGCTAGIRSVSLSADGSRLATRSDYNTVNLWNARTGAKINILRLAPLTTALHNFARVSLSADGSRPATLSTIAGKANM